jgi:NAD(P)-dependent dehydrogenase (short-subunit alcohol dehydrogenase family)
MGRLNGKRAIVTGAASGIGRASVLRFAEEGAIVLAADVDADGVAETARLANTAGGRAAAVTIDASSEAAVAGLVESCVEDLGGLEVMFANAGITGELKPLLELGAADWRRVLDVNLVGVFVAVKHAALAMQGQGGGSIICTASVAGLRAAAGPTPYSAAKAGVVSLVQTAANQLAGCGIRVNAICPGLIETGMTKPIFELARAAGREHKIGQLNPLKRAGAPVEIANMAVFLASDESSYVNGQAIAVDGGLSSTHPFVPGRLA